ncbi:hypothetical protein M4A92_15675 [Caldibacillus thermoamylovorans]|uniref:hypothetical protein n=1 Tax=Caldibacillus thermoamylovorans TaxID=35841 RepID=UPI00203FD8CF|nr:hypothetical protein [Caldibacillus thermoamylovorans]MCM3800034.1 hypothetical protein [Caldibacillus thermoamylovorans]
MQQLLREYKEALKETRKLKENAPEEDTKIINGMISNLEYIIKWLETGWPPKYKRIRKTKYYYHDYYWEDEIGFVKKSTYKDPFEEVEKRIDAERMKKNG